MATPACAQELFITIWKTDNPGNSNNTSIAIPTYEGNYNYEIDWNNDGIYDQSNVTGAITHVFFASGTYTIRIRGTFPMIRFNSNWDRLKLLGIVQWGEVAWADMTRAFGCCENLSISATDQPDLSGVKSMSGMFTECTNLNRPANIGSWNISPTILIGWNSNPTTPNNRSLGAVNLQYRAYTEGYAAILQL